MAEKILIVDDDYDFISITKSQIEKGGYNVEVAYDGKECLKKVHRNKPDLIILDVMMPGLNGYDTCAELKSDEKTRSIPVILLTAVVKNLRTTTYTQRQGLETEADDYLTKPPDTEVLLGTIKKFIRKQNVS